MNKNLAIILLFAFVAGLNPDVSAQEITVYQYRQVPAGQAEEFINRETTYWSKVARKLIDKGTLTFWALLEKVGGDDLQNSSNFLFVNTYKDIDDIGNNWNANTVFPNIPIAKMETHSVSKVTGQIFLKSENWGQSSKAIRNRDFKYVIIVYHNSTDPGKFIALENKYWAPFIKTAMDNNETAQVAWGNSILLTQPGADQKFNSISYDFFPTLKAALVQEWKENTKFPAEGLDSLQKISVNAPARAIYRIVKEELKK